MGNSCKETFPKNSTKNRKLTQNQIRLNQELIRACQQHDLKRVKKLIQRGASVDYISTNGQYKAFSSTSLYRAMRGKIENENNFISLIQFLIKQGGDCNFKTYTRTLSGYREQDKVFSAFSSVFQSLSCQKLKLKFLKIVMENKTDINQSKTVQIYDINKVDFRRSQNFIFDILDQSNIRNRTEQIAKLQHLPTLQQIQQEREWKYWREFVEQKRSLRDSKFLNQNFAQFDGMQQVYEINPSKLEFIQNVIELGIDPNSRSTQYYKFMPINRDKFRFWTINLPKLPKEHVQIYKTSETVLHRCIMNNIPWLVKILIQKGANIDQKCIYTASKLIYPNQWPKQFKWKYDKRNEQLLYQLFYQLDWLQKIGVQRQYENEQQLQNYLFDFQYQIFKLQKYRYEDELPHEISQQLQIGCMELAELFNVDEQIINILKEKMVK